MSAKCPACGSTVSGRAIDPATGLAQCGKCGYVFNGGNTADSAPRFGSFKPDGAAYTTAAEYGTAQSQFAPRGISMNQENADLVIKYSWFAPSAIFMLFFCIFWDSFLVFWYAAAFTKNGPIVMFVFPLLHVAVGVGITYATLASFINSTVIRINPAMVVVRHGPLPYYKNKDIPAQDIAQFYTAEHVSHTKNGTSVSYEVWLEMKTLPRIRLLRGITTAEQAQFIEREAEKFLRITNRPVTDPNALN